MNVKEESIRHQYKMATRRRLLRNVFKTPSWLKRAYKDPERFIKEDFLSRDFLKDSFVYACAGSDGTPVKYWSGLAHSFIYFDAWYKDGSNNTYNVYNPNFLELKGYKCFFEKEITLMGVDEIEEIWEEIEKNIRRSGRECFFPFHQNEKNVKIKSVLSDEIYWKNNFKDASSIPKDFRTFAYVCLYKKLPGYSSLHGPDLLSLTFVSGEATTSYYRLFNKNCVAPRVICTFNSGMGDHIGIQNKNSIFAEVMRMNKGGLPVMAMDNNCEEYSKVLHYDEKIRRRDIGFQYLNLKAHRDCDLPKINQPNLLLIRPLKKHSNYNLPKKIEKILSIDPKTDLFAAAEEGNLNKFISIANERKTEINSKDLMGMTPLMIASAKGKYEICRFLLENGADVNLKNSEGEDALFLAASSERAFDVCRLLIEWGADVNSKNKKGETPLIAAQTLNDKYKTYELLCLLNHGSKIFNNIKEEKNEK